MESDHPIFLQIMLLHDFIQIALSDFLANFAHSLNDIVRGDGATTVRVKLTEYGLKISII